MEIFNIHLFEFLLIAGLALIIFGPQRLPEVGRFLGKQLARFLAWQQQSPEIQVINEVRADLDREIASLRDELVRARSQLDVSQDVETLRRDLRAMVRLRDDDLAVKVPLNGAQAAEQVPAAAVPKPVPLAPSDSVAVPASRVQRAPKPQQQAGEAVPAPLSEEAQTRLDGQQAEASAEVLQPAAAEHTHAAQDAPRPEVLPAVPPGTVPSAPPGPLPTAQASGVRNTIDAETFELLKRQEALQQQVEAVEATSSSGAEYQQLVQQVALMHQDLHDLIMALQARGVLDVHWRQVGVTHDQERVAQ